MPPRRRRTFVPTGGSQQPAAADYAIEISDSAIRKRARFDKNESEVSVDVIRLLSVLKPSPRLRIELLHRSP